MTGNPQVAQTQQQLVLEPSDLSDYLEPTNLACGQLSLACTMHSSLLGHIPSLSKFAKRQFLRHGSEHHRTIHERKAEQPKENSM